LYLIDTNVVSEQRKGSRANVGVRKFFSALSADRTPAYLSGITIGELRRGVELIRYRGDDAQALQLENWLESMLNEYAFNILGFEADAAQVWGKLRVPHHENAIDKQIAAIAMVNGLTLVTRNISDFQGLPLSVKNPFE
jgi:toxin FitB